MRWYKRPAAPARLLLLPLLFCAMGAALLQDPPPLQVPDGLGDKQVCDAVLAALAWRGWTTTADCGRALAEGGLSASLQIRNHRITVRISLDARQVGFRYEDSTDMGYKLRDGVAFIHGNYMNWVQILRRETERRLKGWKPG